MNSDIEILDSLYNETEVYIFGAGDRGQFTYAALNEKGVACRAFLDNSKEKQEKFSFFGVPCIAPEDATGNVSIVVTPAPKYQASISEQLGKLNGRGNRKIYYLSDDLYWRMYRNISDEGIIQCRWHQRKPGITLHLNHPETFNEKIQWIKLHYRPNEYICLADKNCVKKWISDHNISGLNVIPTIGIWDSFDEIDIDKLPQQFVLKCTHDSGSVVICRDRHEFDIKSAREKLSAALTQNYYWYDREWCYKGIKPAIIAEPYLTDESGYELKDYKFQCFNGKVGLIQVDFGRFTKHRRNLYDRDWNFIDAEILYPNDTDHEITRPANLEEMITIAEKLSKPFPYVRIDLYDISNQIYFGEFTFYHGGGYEEFRPYDLDVRLGELIHLPL